MGAQRVAPDRDFRFFVSSSRALSRCEVAGALNLIHISHQLSNLGVESNLQMQFGINYSNRKHRHFTVNHTQTPSLLEKDIISKALRCCFVQTQTLDRLYPPWTYEWEIDRPLSAAASIPPGTGPVPCNLTSI